MFGRDARGEGKFRRGRSGVVVELDGFVGGTGSQKRLSGVPSNVPHHLSMACARIKYSYP